MFKVYCVFISFFIGSFMIGSPVSGQEQKDTLQYKVELNFSGRKISGTFSQIVAGGGLKVDALYKNWHLENKTTYRYNKTNTRLIEDNWYDLVTLKYYPKGKKKLYPGIFYHFDNSLVFRVKNRHQYGVGLGSLLGKGPMKLSLLAAIAYEHSTFNGSEFVNSEIDSSNRNNGLFLFKLNNGHSIIENKIIFSYQLFYFQSLRERTDYDVWLTSRVSFNILKGLSAFVAYDYRFENVHLEPLSKYNDIVLFGFNWALGTPYK